MKKLLPILAILFLSCNFMDSSDEHKKLDERKYKIGDLEINRYKISLITSSHDYVDVTKDGKTVTILKANDGNIDTLTVVKDTLIVKIYRYHVIYDRVDSVFGYHIKIDSLPASY